MRNVKTLTLLLNPFHRVLKLLNPHSSLILESMLDGITSRQLPEGAKKSRSTPAIVVRYGNKLDSSKPSEILLLQL